MPNYSLVINSKFRPFSYQEMLAPVQQSTEAHQKAEDMYGSLQVQADQWKKVAQQEPNSRAAALYNKYAQDLEEQAGVLAAQGLTPGIRNNIWNMTKRYTSEIHPIEEAYNKREADRKVQQEAMLKDPTHFFDRYADEVSIDEYLLNSNLDILSKQHSGALLSQQVGQAAQALKAKLTEKGALAKLGLPHQYERALHYGVSIDDVMKAMLEDSEASPILTSLVDNVMAASGIRDWGSMNGDWENNNTYKKAKAAAMQGLYQAIGTDKIEHFTDSYGMQLGSERAKAAAEAAAKAAAKKEVLRAMIDPVNLYNKVRNERRDAWEKEGLVVNRNGTYSLSESGKNSIRAYQQMLSQTGWNPERLESYLMGTSEETGKNRPSLRDAKAAKKGLLLMKDLQDISAQTGSSFSLYNYTQDGKSSYGSIVFNDEGISSLLTDDLNKTVHSQTAYRYQIGHEDSQDVLSTILSDYGEGATVDIMKYNGDKKQYEKSGTMKRKDLSDYTINNVQVSTAGNIIELLDENNHTVTVRLPKSRNNQRLEKILGNITRIQEQLSTMSPEDKGYSILEEELANQEAAIYSTFSDSYRKNKSKDQGFEANSKE